MNSPQYSCIVGLFLFATSSQYLWQPTAKKNPVALPHVGEILDQKKPILKALRVVGYEPCSPPRRVADTEFVLSNSGFPIHESQYTTINSCFPIHE